MTIHYTFLQLYLCTVEAFHGNAVHGEMVFLNWNCSGNEDRFQDCLFSTFHSSCTHSNVAGLSCVACKLIILLCPIQIISS